MRWLRKHRFQLASALAFLGTTATILVAIFDGDGFDIVFSAIATVAFALTILSTASVRPRDALMYTEQPITGWGWPSPKRSGMPWGPKVPDDYDERNS
jgi:archaellum biogenesis protein FlaJ (TadC family)